MLPRKILLFALFGFISTQSFGQFTLGLQFSPSISANRIESSSDSASISTDGTGVRMALGPIADIQIRENYFFSTGLLFVSKRVGIESTSNNQQLNEEYSLQYIQVPLTLKLFTNEVALDKKIYFQVGGTLDFNINEEAKSDANVLVNDFLIFDSSLLIGLGVEYKVGVNTIVFGGFTYHRGLVNAVNKQGPLDGDLNIKNDYISLDLGVKF